MLPFYLLFVFLSTSAFTHIAAPLQSSNKNDTSISIQDHASERLYPRARIARNCNQVRKTRIVLLLQRVAQWSERAVRYAHQRRWMQPGNVMTIHFHEDNNHFRAIIHEHFRVLGIEALNSPRRLPTGAFSQGRGRVRIQCDRFRDLCDSGEVTVVNNLTHEIMLVSRVAQALS